MKKTLSFILSLIMLTGIVLSAPVTVYAADEIPTLTDGPEINMIALADRDYTYATAYYENTQEAMKFYSEWAKYDDTTDYLIDNYGFSDEEYAYHNMYVYVQTAYSLNGGQSWVNDFDRDEDAYYYDSNSNVEISGYDVYLPTQSANLNEVQQYDTIFALDFYDWQNTKKDAIDDAVNYITQGKGTYIEHDGSYHTYEVNLTAANSLLAKSRYVVVVRGKKAGEDEYKLFTTYSDWGNTFSFSATTTPESEDFMLSGEFDAPVLEFYRKSGKYYYFGILPGEELSEAIAEHHTLYDLGLTDDYYKNWDTYSISWYFELKINDGDWFHYNYQSAVDLTYDNIHDSYLTDDLEYYYGITLQPEDRIYIRTRLMTNGQTEKIMLDNTENSDGRYYYGPGESMTFISDYSEPVEIPFSGRYRISYDLNWGDWPNYNTKIYEFGEEDTDVIDLTSEDYVPVRYGYTFGGWYTTEDFQEGTEITEIDLNVKKFTSVYAKWETEGEYDIKYELGISGAYHYNQTMYTPLMDDIELEDAIYSGVTFAGWYETEDFSGEPVTVIDTARKENITLYAKWDFPTYTINYELDGGVNNEHNPLTFQVNVDGGGDALLFEPAKQGYVFDGWYYDEDFYYSVSKYDDGWHFNATQDTTVYAKWIIGRWDINYINVLDGAVNEDFYPYNGNPTQYTYGDTVTLKDLSSTGYVFGGWFTDEACTVPASDITATDEGEKTFYAKWNEIVLTITYVYNSDTANSPDASTVTNTNPAERKYSETIELTDAATSDKGYTFEGWHSDLNLASDKVTRVYGDKNVTLYAKWLPAVYNLTYILNNGTNNNANPATFTYNNKGGEEAVLKAPTRTDYIFDGWYYDAAFTLPVEKRADGWYFNGSEDTTVYAKWIIGKWSISYVHVIDGKINNTFNPVNDNPTQYKYGTTPKLNPLSATGYVFGGWFTDAACTTPAATISATDMGEKTFYAKWTEKVINISYVLNADKDNSPDISTVTNNNPSSKKYSETVELKNAASTDSDYTFEGWYTNAKFNSGKVTYVTGEKDVTYYAKWKKKVVYVPHWGDVSLSNYVTAADARTILRYSAKLETGFNDIQKRLADVTNDGRITAADARIVLRMSAKLETENKIIEQYKLPKIEIRNGNIVFS